MKALSLILTATLTTPVWSQSITVTTSRNDVDIPLGATITDLPGADGVVSFREALRVSDNEPGRQTIGFAIPEDDWYLADIFPGLVILQGSTMSASQPVIIDGTTQTAFTGDTNPDGHEILLPLQTYLNGGNSIVTGIHASRVELGGVGPEVYGNTGGMDIRLVLATDGYVHDNEADNINITYSNHCRVVRNVTERVRMTGWGIQNPATGNVIGGPDPADRNYITGFGNFGEHGSPSGDCIELYYTDGNLIQNNYIGTTPDGMAVSNRACTTGIAIHNSNHNLQILDNLIAVDATNAFGGGDYGVAIYLGLYEGGDQIAIKGNTLGLNALGEPVLGGQHGVWVSADAFEDAGMITIGGQSPGDGNVIASHDSTGVLMMYPPGIQASARVRVSGNSIYGNGDIGIDLMPNTWDYGSTPNDPMDVDLGANSLQNYPVIDSAIRTGAQVSIEGSLQSSPNSTFVLEFFSNPACDASGLGQGMNYLGSASVATDVSGLGLFLVDLPSIPAEHGFVTATATRALSGETSEFSACTGVEAGCIADLTGDGVLDFFDVSAFLNAYNVADPIADLTGDGVHDFFDISAFLNAFNAGCP
jgi:hypothetical protein